MANELPKFEESEVCMCVESSISAQECVNENAENMFVSFIHKTLHVHNSHHTVCMIQLDKDSV